MSETHLSYYCRCGVAIVCEDVSINQHRYRQFIAAHSGDVDGHGEITYGEFCLLWLGAAESSPPPRTYAEHVLANSPTARAWLAGKPQRPKPDKPPGPVGLKPQDESAAECILFILAGVAVVAVVLILVAWRLYRSGL